MAENYPKVEPLSPVNVTSNYNVTSTPYGLNGIAILRESDHEQLQSYRNMSEVEQDYDIDSDVWQQANNYFGGLNGDNGLLQVISFDKNYGQNTSGNGSPIITPPSGGQSGSNDKQSDNKGGNQ